MKLDAFFSVVAPMLTGRGSHEETAKALYGGDPRHARDAERLAIYQQLCRIHRGEALAGVHREVEGSIRALGGEPLWDRVVAGYFEAHPMHSAELNENGAALAAWLREQGAGLGLPAWIAELADLEQWEWLTMIAPEAARDAPGGPLRIASTVELRPYRHDLVGWLDAGLRAAAPEPRDVFVLFWRDRDLLARRQAATARELAVLQLVHAASPVDPVPFGGTLDELRRAAVLVGEP